MTKMVKAKYYLRNLEVAKKEFIARLKSTKKVGIGSLLAYLEGNGFYKVPASTNHHLNCDSGLLVHSLLVCDTLMMLNEELDMNIPRDSLLLTALLHDICKIEQFAKHFVNGEWSWTYKAGSDVREHGKRSADLVNSFIRLKDYEYDMIRWHMGAYTKYYDATIDEFFRFTGDRNNPNSNLAQILYFADHLSTIALEDDE